MDQQNIENNNFTCLVNKVPEKKNQTPYFKDKILIKEKWLFKWKYHNNDKVKSETAPGMKSWNKKLMMTGNENDTKKTKSLYNKSSIKKVLLFTKKVTFAGISFLIK